MKTPDQLLDSLLDKARSQPELMSVESVHTLTASARPFTKPLTFKIMTLIISTILTTAAAITWYAGTAHTAPAKPIIQSSTVAGIEIPAQEKEATIKSATKDNMPLFENKIAEAAYIVDETGGQPLPYPSQIPEMPASPAPPEQKEALAVKPVQQTNPYLRLTNDQLLKLGIMYKEDVLIYKVDKTCLSDVEVYIAGHTRSTKCKGTTLVPLNPLAWFITDENGVLKEAIQFEKRDRFQTEAPGMVPVLVEDTAAPDKQYIFWFENESVFRRLLPDSIQENLKQNPLYYSHIFTPQTEEEEQAFTINAADTATMPAYNTAMLVVADDQLMKQLGINRQKQGYTFKRSFNGKKLDVLHGEHVIFNQQGNYNNEKEPANIKQVMPSFITGSRFSLQYHILCFEDKPRAEHMNIGQYFLNNRQQYIPVMMPVDCRENIFWYKPTQVFMATLNLADRTRVEKELANPSQHTADVSAIKPSEPDYLKIFEDEQTIVIEGVKALSLQPEQLKELRISVNSEKSVNFIMHDQSNNFTPIGIYKNGITFSPDNTHSPQNSFDYEFTDNTMDTINPELITDDLGRMPRIAFGAHAATINTAQLIPVLVRTGAKYTAIDKLQQHWRPDLIFWYAPTEQFLSLLDSTTAREIKNDLAAITQKEKQDLKPVVTHTDTMATLSCKYFEACRNVKGTISSHNMYPNPAQQSVNISFKASEAADVTISLTDINGKLLLKNRHHVTTEGDNVFTMPLSGLEAGIYLVYIQSDKGDYLYERLIKN